VGVAPGTTTGSLAKALATVGGEVVVVVLVGGFVVVVVGFVVVVVGFVVVVVVVVVDAFAVTTFGVDVDVAIPW
jgi:hypothetical protein